MHGLTDEFLADKPLFAQVADELLEFLTRRRDHHPQRRLRRRLPRRRAAPPRPAGVHRATSARVTDSLSMAREIFPGKSNSLDALCKRLEVDNSSAHAARRAARRRPAGRGLHPHDARPELAGHRRRRRRAPPTLAARPIDFSALELIVVVADEAESSRRTRRCSPRSTRPAAATRCGGRRRWPRPRPWHNDALSKRPIRAPRGAVSSGVEHDIHTVGVGGSKPSPPTNRSG